MLHMTKYFYRISALLLAAAVLCLAFGGRGFLRFLADTDAYKVMSVREFAVAVLLPHILLLAGICFAVFGGLMLVKGVLFGREHGR